MTVDGTRAVARGLRSTTNEELLGNNPGPQTALRIPGLVGSSLKAVSFFFGGSGDGYIDGAHPDGGGNMLLKRSLGGGAGSVVKAKESDQSDKKEAEKPKEKEEWKPDVSDIWNTEDDPVATWGYRVEKDKDGNPTVRSGWPWSKDDRSDKPEDRSDKPEDRSDKPEDRVGRD